MLALSSYLWFVRQNGPFLAAGALLTFMSSFGQTFFLSVFGGDIRTEFGLSNGEWGLIYMVGTGASAIAMVFAGGLIDRFRARSLGGLVLGLLSLACLGMAFNSYIILLPLVIFALRFLGQGMVHHVATTAMSRWFIATRGRALAIASLGFMLAEATFPLIFVWLKGHFHWQTLWIANAIFVMLMIPVLLRLLRLERTPQANATSDDAAGMLGRHWTRADALKHPLLWALLPSIMAFPALGTAFWFHQVHFAEIKGWDHLSLVAVFPLGTISFLTFTFVYGWALDRFGPGKLFPIYLLPLSIAFVLHAYAPTIAWSALGVVLMGMAGGGQATLPAAIWAGYYGTRNIGSIKSAVAAMMVLGSALGPGLSGWLIDRGIGFEDQMLAYAAIFIITSVITIRPLARASEQLPRSA